MASIICIQNLGVTLFFAYSFPIFMTFILATIYSHLRIFTFILVPFIFMLKR